MSHSPIMGKYQRHNAAREQHAPSSNRRASKPVYCKPRMERHQEESQPIENLNSIP